MSNSTRWVVVAVAALIIGVGGVLLGKSMATPDSAAVQESAEAFVNSLVSGDVDGTYNNASSTYQARNTKEYVRTISETLRADNPEISNEEVFFGTGDSKDEALYLNTVKNLPRTDINSDEGNFVIRLVKEDGKWKVDSSQVY